MSQISNIFKSLCKLRKNIHSQAQTGLCKEKSVFDLLHGQADAVALFVNG